MQSVANIRIYSNIRIFFSEYLIFEYKYPKIGIRIYLNIRINKKLEYEYIRIFVNSLRIYSNICKFIMNTIEYSNHDHVMWASVIIAACLIIWDYTAIKSNQVSMQNLIQPITCYTFNWGDLNHMYYSNIR